MKNLILLFISLVIGMTVATPIHAATYHGNGNEGFGGAIGYSILDITDDGTSLFFELTRGPGALNDTFVLYINSTTGGLSNNTTMFDAADPLRAAISGDNGASHVDINFGFDADYAIALNASTGALFTLEAGGNNSLTYISTVSGGYGEYASVYSFDLLLSDIGVAAFSGQSIEFVGTYINPSNALLSNEGYGAGLPPINPLSSSVIFTGSEFYETSAVPVPAAAWLFASGLIGLIGIARRKKS